MYDPVCNWIRPVFSDNILSNTLKLLHSSWQCCLCAVCRWSWAASSRWCGPPSNRARRLGSACYELCDFSASSKSQSKSVSHKLISRMNAWNDGNEDRDDTLRLWCWCEKKCFNLEVFGGSKHFLVLTLGHFFHAPFRRTLIGLEHIGLFVLCSSSCCSFHKSNLKNRVFNPLWFYLMTSWSETFRATRV